MKLVVLLFALIAGSGSAWADTTFKLTKVTSVENDGLYVFEQSGMVMSGTVNKSSQQPTTSTYITSGLTGSETYIWKLVMKGSSNTYYMLNVNSNHYLSYSGSSTGLKNTSVMSESTAWEFNFQNDETVLIQEPSSKRYFGFSSNNSGLYKAYSSNDLSTYQHAITVYKLVEEDDREEAGLAYDPTSITLELGDTFTAPTFNNPNGLNVTFSSNNADVATVDANTGDITFVGGLGKAVITATSEKSTTYQLGLATFTINVIRKTPTLLVSGDLSMKTGESVIIDDDIYQTDSDGDVTITSGTPTVISVSEGKLNALTEGTATITVSAAQSDTYAAVEESFVITVTANPSVTPEGQGTGGGYTLVTDHTTLAEGDEIIFVSDTTDGIAFAMSKTQNSNNRGTVSVTISDKSISSPANDVQRITLEGNATDGWYFNVGTDQYLYAASSSNNYLRTGTKSVVGDNGKASISITSSTGVASIIFQGSYTRNVLQHNSSNSIYACYGSASQKPVYIYRRNQATSFDIEIGSTGWRTLVSAHDVVSLPSGLKAYTVTEQGATSVKLTEVSKIAKNTPYLLEGGTGSYTLSVSTDEVTAPTDNLLRISDAATGSGVYVLAEIDSEVGFYKWTGGYIGAGRVYLPASDTDARQFLNLGFDDETTGLGYIVRQTNKDAKNIEVYNLNGQRIAQPTKGLYIVNGKKVLF